MKEKCGDTQAQKCCRCADTQDQKHCRCGGAQAVHWTQSARTQKVCEAQCARTQGSSWKQCVLIRSCYMGEAAYFSWNLLSYPCLSLLCSGFWSDVWFLVLSSDNSSDWLNVYTLMDEWIRFLMTHLYVIWWTRSDWWLSLYKYLSSDSVIQKVVWLWASMWLLGPVWKLDETWPFRLCVVLQCI